MSKILVTGGAGFLDSHLCRAELRWQPTVQLADGLTRTIDYFRETLSL